MKTFEPLTQKRPKKKKKMNVEELRGRRQSFEKH